MPYSGWREGAAANGEPANWRKRVVFLLVCLLLMLIISAKMGWI